jgi:anti-anti-sigma regulatory factor
VARAGDTVILRPIGLGNMKIAMGLMDFTAATLRDGCAKYVFDLSLCRGLDSTFMGAMVGLASASAEMGGSVSLVNTTQSHVELLQIVGADKFLRMLGPRRMEDIEMERIEPGAPGAERRIEMIRRAHENLVGIDQRNAAKFGAFLRQLSSELDRQP